MTSSRRKSNILADEEKSKERKKSALVSKLTKPRLVAKTEDEQKSIV
jgi:hypothetical protein